MSRFRHHVNLRVSAVLRPGGVSPPAGFQRARHLAWPRRLTQAEIRTIFEQGWKVEAISTSRFEVVDGCGGADAWLASIRRLSPAGLTGEI